MSRNVLDFLLDLVSIRSASENTQGVNEVQSRLKVAVEQQGGDVSLVSSPSGKTAKALLGSWAPLRKPKLRILLVGHADTVLERKPSEKPHRILANGKWIKGLGIIDDKAALVSAIEAIRRFLKSSGGENRLQIDFLSSPCEELGSPGWSDYFKKLGKKADTVLGLEPALDDGSVIGRRRGNRWYEVLITGKSAHAGRNFAQGINAAHELACKIEKIHRLTQWNKEVSVNVGSFGGGENKFNVVCDHAWAKIDLRFATTRDRDRTDKRIRQILSATLARQINPRMTPKVRVAIADDCPPFFPHSDSKALFRQAQRILLSLEKKKLEQKVSGGASDVNYISRSNGIALDGLGPYGKGIHTPEESLFVPSLETRTEMLFRLFLWLNQQA